MTTAQLTLPGTVSQSPVPPARPRLLRAVLLSNAAFSTLSGIAVLAAAKELAPLAGIAPPEIVTITGAGTLVFAVVVARTASRRQIRPREVWPLIAGDLAWVAASVWVVASDVPSGPGKWLLGGIGCIVALLGLLELCSLRNLRRWTVVPVLLACLAGAFFWAQANTLADLRPDKFRQREPLPSDVTKGRALLAQTAERHGRSARRNFHVMDYTAVDRWSASFPAKSWWPERVQRIQHSLLLGTFTSRVELLDGAHAGEIWGIQSWSPYKYSRGRAAPEWPGNDPAIHFYLPTLHYFAELPFRVVSAQNVAWAGERAYRGHLYNIVLATWGGFAPNPVHDQYEIWIGHDTGLIEMAQYTLREALPFVTGTIHFEDYRSIQNVMVPFRQTVTLWRPTRTQLPLNGNYFHQLLISDAGFDRVSQSLLHPDPQRTERGDWKPFERGIR